MSTTLEDSRDWIVGPMSIVVSSIQSIFSSIAKIKN